MKTKLGRRAMPSEDNLLIRVMLLERREDLLQENPSRGAPRRLPGGGDLVDEAVVERLSCVEITSAPHVLGDLPGAPAGPPRRSPRTCGADDSARRSPPGC